MAAINRGPTTWGLDRDREGYTTYRITYKVFLTDYPDEGPGVALTAPDLPRPGDLWVFGSEVDLNARCTPEAKVEAHPNYHDEPVGTFYVSFTFTDKPANICNPEALIADPLLEPPSIEVTTRGDTVEAVRDRYGDPVVNSAHEPIKGQPVQFRDGAATITISMNVPTVDRNFILGMLFTLNDAPLWGFEEETLLLTGAPMQNKYHGDCECYLAVKLVFEWKAGGWHHDVLDEGSKCLRGEWKPDGSYEIDIIDGAPASPSNPTHFKKATDSRGNPWRLILDGSGRPANVMTRHNGSFVSLSDGNLGNPVSDAANWQAVVGDAAGRQWHASATWKRGSVVFDEVGRYFVAKQDVGSDVGEPPDEAAYWVSLGAVAPAAAGEWSGETTYVKADLVTAPASSRPPARILIEYYPSENFLLLPNLPATLDCPGA